QSQIYERMAPVALMMKQDASLVAAIIGILRGGGFYFVPNLGAPSSRLKQMLADVRPSAILADHDHIDIAREANAVQTKLFLFDELPHGLPAFIPRARRDETPCAIFYTSGSSRTPRPLVYTHGGTLQNALNHRPPYEIRLINRRPFLHLFSAPTLVSPI